MDLRLMARGLRARPTPFLQQTQALPRFSLLNVRYNSSDSSPKTPSQPPATENKPEQPKPVSDFDDILNKLDLNQRPRDNQNSHRIFSDSLARAVGQGAQSAARLRSRPAVPVRKIELKLGPTLGRQAHVEPSRGTDLASAIRKLGQTIAQNKIRQDSASQRFHVRKGMVRKQKKMQRWKKLFKVSFQGTVKKIQRMQAQGW
ncbi:unnamed protein product [Penicillium salamii]|nr:unnamed protein product [Penicillium salamii]